MAEFQFETTTTGGGGGGASAYEHVQGVSTTTWTIDHGLGYMPAVTVIDSAGTIVEGDVSYPTINQVVLDFAVPFSGKAYLS